MRLAVALAAVVGLVLLAQRWRDRPRETDLSRITWRDLERVDSV